ncbi:MAG TPA: septal ring lytic transglycosylase RlpA family protein [Dongiaceae bacterium]|nr:septal ring lytic transglycosylase RlpA family protein [Dongiaceae bacterium]
MRTCAPLLFLAGLLFGTRVRVTNLANHQNVVVTVVDRGPFRAGRVIDVSRRAGDGPASGSGMSATR